VSTLIRGPYGWRFAITHCARDLWAAYCPHVDLTTIEHAVRFSRFVTEAADPATGRRAALLAYPFDRLLFIAKHTPGDPPAVWAVAAVFSAPYSPRRFNCRLSKHPELKDLVFGHETPGPYNEATRKEWSNWYRAFNPEGWKAYVALREEQGMARARQRDEGAPCGK
jgi:hypothetical protein